MNITLPEFALIVLIGPSGSGKSTFARTHFGPTEVLSSDFCRGLIVDDENDQSATADAFEVLHFIAAKRLDNMRLTVIDATNVQPFARRPLIALAREYHVLPVAIVFDLPIEVCHARNKERTNRQFGKRVIAQQRHQMRRSIKKLKNEGFRRVHTLRSETDVASVTIERERLWNDLKHEHGPFDIIGDVHGCFDELVGLLEELDYTIAAQDGSYHVQPPDDRKAVFVGDLVDRGPKTPDVLRLVMGMVEADKAICVPGNHDVKLQRALRGRRVKIAHGLAESLEQLEAESPEFRDQVAEFIFKRTSHYILDGGKLVVAHAGMKEDLLGRASSAVRDFALYGETTGETDEFGLPVRHVWAREYRGEAMVVYGHTPVPEPEWLNRTINIDTGCVFGGELTALRYPELELVSVPAEQMYAEPARPLLADRTSILSAQQQVDDMLDISDVLGRRIVDTRLRPNITIREGNAAAALEVMSRFAVNPKWLIYLPPTMSPTETSAEPDLLEYPAEAFDYYRKNQVEEVICEEKHMGSRAVVIVCKNKDVARERFGVLNEGIGICYTRTGRRFFDDAALEAAFLTRICDAVEQAGIWQELETDWLCLDCELMPWSAKAQELLRQQYAAVGAAARSALAETVTTLELGASRGADVGDLLNSYQSRADMVDRYVNAYRHYCWSVQSIDDLKLAPFHLLASEGAVHVDKNHLWHMDTLARICTTDPGLLLATPYRVVDLANEDSQAQAIDWWAKLTGRGGEGMVVKPLDFVARGQRGLLQPAVKCRGREYLRIIYGPEYTAPENMERLRKRNLRMKRSLALREFALGTEALERFARREPLRRVHECVFGVLALESEPVDPRL
jgi:protein phosphatase